MATDHRFDPYGDQPETEKRPRNWLTTCLIGCLVMVVVVLLLGGLLVYWVSQNWRGWTSAIVSEGIKQTVNESDLPQQEKDEINAQVNRVAEGFSEGTLSNEQMVVIIEKLVESPILSAIVVSTVDETYFQRSGLTEEEKAEGRKTVQRFLTGTINGAIDRNSMDNAMAHVADRQQDGTWRLRDQVTDAELRAFLAAAKAEADEANIPEEPEPFDPSDEIKRIIDEAMAEPATAP